ncbi:hypothetical protein GCT13_30870 [Paraburkholderia sp. CNPSo 3157]|uniref:Uncharacterized protein n=2 Tax=Paraburkholderia franconis TaxID=2654983 RepID=A0A7X1TJ81_9BURK|nr:hypothetical protein [Paraburkholderia franconis]
MTKSANGNPGEMKCRGDVRTLKNKKQLAIKSASAFAPMAAPVHRCLKVLGKFDRISFVTKVHINMSFIAALTHAGKLTL